MTAEHYDVIIIGSGAGGGTLAHKLAPSGKRILLLERGGYLPRERENWDSREVFDHERYVTTERWYDKHGVAFRPHAQYFVGGNTKVYGGVLFRVRERDFERVEHRCSKARGRRKPVASRRAMNPRGWQMHRSVRWCESARGSRLRETARKARHSGPFRRRPDCRNSELAAVWLRILRRGAR